MPVLETGLVTPLSFRYAHQGRTVTHEVRVLQPILNRPTLVGPNVQMAIADITRQLKYPGYLTATAHGQLVVLAKLSLASRLDAYLTSKLAGAALPYGLAYRQTVLVEDPVQYRYLLEQPRADTSGLYCLQNLQWPEAQALPARAVVTLAAPLVWFDNKVEENKRLWACVSVSGDALLGEVEHFFMAEYFSFALTHGGYGQTP